MDREWLIVSVHEALPNLARLGHEAMLASDVSAAEEWFSQGVRSGKTEEGREPRPDP